MPSEPVALLGLILRINAMISSFLIFNWSILYSVRKIEMGNTLLLIIGLHCEKKTLKSLAFSLQSKINRLFIRRGGILGALHLFITLFIIFQ